MRQAIFVMLSLSATVVADDTKTDLNALQGKWKTVKVIREGKDVPADEVAKLDAQMLVKDVTMVGSHNGVVVHRYRIELNPKANPKQAELMPIDEKGRRMLVNYAGPKGESRYIDAPMEYAIYAVDGDKLKLCIAMLDQARAKSFDAKDTKGYTVIEMERVKK